MREETVTVKIDHPLGSTDEDNPSVVYPINCGYVDVERTAGFSELDKQRVYLLGVDVAVDEYIGELIAVARRRDDPETVWIIAPENISYTIQQIEEMIYFEEQYYDSFVEIVDEELWDAYDENEKLLGFDLKRSQAKSLPDGVYHVIVNVYTMTKDGKLLTTERSRNKTYPLKWEVTGGSIKVKQRLKVRFVSYMKKLALRFLLKTSLYSTAMWINLSMPYITVILI